MRYHKLLSCLLALGLLAACATSTPTAVATEEAALPIAALPTLPADVLIQISRPDGTIVPISVDDLKTLPLVQLMAEGKVEEGPSLSDVLALAGVTEYSTVSLNGTSSPVTLTREQVETDAMLDYTNHGTVKLSTNTIPKADWTKDVSWIEVK